MSTTTTVPEPYTMDGEETAEVVFKILVYIIGVIGNLLVIFVILFLAEYKKITHWYVLQMAIADILFLQNLPFKLTEDMNGRWVHAPWLCSAQQTVLFFTYYASILFLMIMAIDRYLAVCHTMSSKVQRIRTSKNSYFVALATWLIALAMSVPGMLYSTTAGNFPYCVCTLMFPKDPGTWCIANSLGNKSLTHENGTLSVYDDCILNVFPLIHDNTCANLNTDESGSGGSGNPFPFGDYGFDLPSADDAVNGTTTNTEESSSGGGGLPFSFDVYDPDLASEDTGSILKPGCFYDPLRPGWNNFIYFNFIVMFVVPLLVIVVCYSIIVMRLVGSSVPGDSSGSGKIYKGSRKGSKASTGKSDREKTKVTVLCGLLALLFTVFWLPFHAVHLAKIVGIVTDDDNLCSRLATATTILAYLSSATNPYLYNFLGSFGKRMKQIKESKRMQSLLSATGVTRATVSRVSTTASNDGWKARTSVAPPAEEIPLNNVGENP